jgi:hypothetical protein
LFLALSTLCHKTNVLTSVLKACIIWYCYL